jgi:hypothetical protein
VILTDVHRRELEIRIQRFIGAGPSWDNIVDLVGLAAVDRLPAQVPTVAAARWIIDVAMGSSSAAVLLDVVAKVTLGGDSPELQTLADELNQDPAAWAGTGTEDLWVPVRRPFVDRQALRAHIAAAATGEEGSAVTVIEAPVGYGKRTVATYIEAVCQRAGILRPIVRELVPDPSPGLLDSVVAGLRSALQLPLVRPSTHVEPERAAVVLARDLALAASIATRRVWFIIHLPTAQGLEPGVLSFVDELMGQVQRRVSTARHLRVTLMTTNTAALGLVNLPPTEARFLLPEVAGDSIQSWFSAAVPGKPAELYEVATETVLASLAARDAAPSRRLDWLATECLETHRQLLLAEV